MQTYPYRTTYDKLDDRTAQRHIEESGDTVVSAHYLGGRDWVLLCRSGGPTVADLTAVELEALIARAVGAGTDRAPRPGRPGPRRAG